MGIVGRFKDGDLLLAGEVDERLPVVTDGLTNFFPLDLTPQDRMTEYDNPFIILTNRDTFPAGYSWSFPTNYNYANAVFFISGKVRCIDAADPSLTTTIGFQYTKNTSVNNWVSAKTLVLSDIQSNGYSTFFATFTIPADFQSGLKPWPQIIIAVNAPGYKVEYREVHYHMVSNPNIRLTNGVFIDDALAIEETTTNYFQNGNFMNGLTNWSYSANATTQTKIVTPWGYGVRVQRDAGDGGSWGLNYVGPAPANYNAGETWVFSFKYRVIKGTGRPFSIGWWINDNGSYQCYLPVTTVDLDDGWKQAYAQYTFVGGPYAGNSTTFMNSQASNSIVEFADIQLEKRHLPTGKIEGTRGDGRLEIDISPDPASAYTLISEKMNIFENSFTSHILVKDASNNFTYYKNGAITTEYVNKWSVYTMKGPGYTRYKGNDFTKYVDPIAVTTIADPPNYSMNLSTFDGGVLLRTFVFCTTAVSVTHNYEADNYGSMRVNNGTVMNLGGWEDTTKPLTNPNVTINLNAGWNVIEIAFMDADTGGSLFIASGTALSATPGVAYITAQIPIEFSANKIVYNEKSNCITKNAGIYNRAFTATDMQLFLKTQIPIDANGILKVKVKEYPPYIPSDAYYFPLETDAKDFYKLYGPSTETNTVYDENGVWVGTATENLWATKAGKPVISSNAGGIVIPKAITPVVGTQAWALVKTGSASQCHYYENSYGGSFDGVTGDMITCSLYVKAVNLAGTNISYPFRVANPTGQTFTAVADEIYADKQINEDDNWYRKFAVTKFNQSYTGGYSWDAFRWDYSSQKGLIYICAPQWEKRGFMTPYVEGTRGASLLEYNFNRDLGLDWSKDWSISYFKIPVGSYDGTTQNGYNIESIGCNSNSVGGGYAYWGKVNGANNLRGTAPTFDPTKYFYHRQMVSIVYTASNTTLTVKYWSYTDGVSTWSFTITPTAANYFVNQYGYDFILGGWDNSNPVNSYYKDLVVCKRAMTDTELNNMFYDFGKFDTGNGRLYLPQNKIVETLTLS